MFPYIQLATKKNLNKSEMNSLLASIQQCSSFDNDADTFLNSQKIQKSIVFQYAKVLKEIGFKVKLFRETERYRFMLSLSLQQTWNEIGPIFKNTNFFDLKGQKKQATYVQTDLFNYCYNWLLRGANKLEVAKFIRNSETEVDIRHVAIYQNGADVIIVSFTKPSNIYKPHKIFYRFNSQQRRSYTPQFSAFYSQTMTTSPVILLVSNPQSRSSVPLTL